MDNNFTIADLLNAFIFILGSRASLLQHGVCMPNPEYHPIFWPEMCEAEKENYAVRIESWEQLLREESHTRQLLFREQDLGRLFKVGQNHLNRRRYGTVPPYIPPEKFNLRNMQCFVYLPSVYEECEKFAKFASKMQTVAPEYREQYSEQVRHEMAHSIYLHAMWRNHGRRVYVLDQVTYSLLAETPLPDLPAEILAAPDHSFYLKVPKNSFQFGVWNPHTGETDYQNVEGIMVGIDTIDPDSPNVRELTFMVVGEGDKVENRNIAFISIALGPDAKLSDVCFSELSDSFRQLLPEVHQKMIPRSSEDQQIGVIAPRVILGFLLYLQSEHPDVEPVPPAARRHFKEIKSPKQREQALKNQAQRLRGATRLPILYVGRHLAEEVEAEAAALQEMAEKGDESARRALDHPVRVPGHHKRQWYGKGNSLWKIIFIRPYWKGPDVAEYLKVRAAKLQQARHAQSVPPSQTMVKG
jgi:hypothetical protein